MLSTINDIIRDAPLIAVLLVVFAGALTSMTSCTLIRLPVICGFVAGASDSKKKPLLLTLLFASGIIVSYTVLGILFCLIGEMAFKLIGASKYIFWALGVLLVTIGLFIAGLIKINLPAFKFDSNDKIKRLSFLGPFLFGMTFGLLETPACPCCSSFLLIVAGLVAVKGFSLYFVMLLISFAAGQAIPIVLIGSSTGMLKYLTPKIQRFEHEVRLVAGSVLIVLGIYFLIIA